LCKRQPTIIHMIQGTYVDVVWKQVTYVDVVWKTQLWRTADTYGEDLQLIGRNNVHALQYFISIGASLHSLDNRLTMMLSKSDHWMSTCAYWQRCCWSYAAVIILYFMSYVAESCTTTCTQCTDKWHRCIIVFCFKQQGGLSSYSATHITIMPIIESIN